MSEYRSPERSPSEDLRAILVFTVLVLLSYWPLTSLSYSVVGGDIRDCWLPWYTFIGQAAADGSFPTWNPFQQGGYPIYADLQGPAWSPFTYILANTIGHSMHSILVIAICSLILAGMGMYRLCRWSGVSHRTAILFGAVYISSGFFLQHMMHLYAFMSGAFIVWLMHYLLRLLRSHQWTDGLLASLFAFLQLSSGNHTFTILLAYLLSILALLSLLSVKRSERLAWLRSVTPGIVVFLLATISMSIGVFYSLVEVAPYFSRGDGLTLDDAQYGSAIGYSLYSFLYPYTAGTSIKELDLPSNIENLYMGICTLVLVGISLFRKRSIHESALLIFGLVCLLAAFGPALPVHGFLFHLLPGLDLFRFPGYFAFFTIVCWLPVAACTVDQWPWLPSKLRNVCYLVMGVIGATSLVAAIISLGNSDTELMSWFDPVLTFHQRITMASLEDRLLISMFLTGALLIPGALFLLLRRSSVTHLRGLMWIELIVVLQICMWNCSISEIPPTVTDQPIQMAPKVTPFPADIAMAVQSDSTIVPADLWRNTSNYMKHPSHDGFNSFWLGSHERLENNPQQLERLKQLPPVFVHNGSSVSLPNTHVTWRAFRSDRMTFKVYSPEPAQVCLQQSPYPGWKVKVNNVEQDWSSSFISTMSTSIPGDWSEVEFIFEKPILPYLYLVSVLIFFGTCLYIIMSGPSATWSRYLMITTAILALLLSTIHFFRTPISEKIAGSSLSMWNSMEHALNGSNNTLLLSDVGGNQLVPDRALVPEGILRVDRPSSLPQLVERVERSQQDSCSLFWSDRKPMPELQAYLHAQFPQLEDIAKDEHAGFMLRSRGDRTRPTTTDSLQEGSEFTAAQEFSLDSICSLPGDQLTFSCYAEARNFSGMLLVISHEVNGRMLYYETRKLEDFAYLNRAEAFLVIPKARFAHYKGVLRSYIWNTQKHPLAYAPVQVSSFELVR